MKVLEVLLNRRWILKSRERELYYQVKEALASGEEKKFLREKLGYQVLINPYMIKVEKLPAVPENWMGISDFRDPIEYVFFCLVLMFLEDKEAEEQFVLSELTEYVQSQYEKEQIDWTIYRYRRHMIKVMKYCVACGILDVNDGSEEGFAKDDTSEVLYENTGVSRYFMKNFTQDIMGYTAPKDFEKEEWIDLNEDRGIVRRQRVYRRLLMTMGMYKDTDTEEDFAYVRNYRNMIQGELSELFECELQVHSSSAFLILGENCRLGRTFPEENTLSDIVLLLYQLLQEEIREGKIEVSLDEQIRLPKENFQRLIEKCKERFGAGFNKTYREMTFAEIYREVYDYMENLMMIEQAYGDVCIKPVAGKIVGRYPEDFRKEGGNDE
uniref:TIGR02678 family protein n=1 Tax=Blautia sp. TaxID=1955243 RepID=UPI003FEFB617